MRSSAPMATDLARARDARRQLFLAGTGSFATEVAEWAEQAGWTVVGLIELLDDSSAGSSIAGRTVVAAGDASDVPAVIAVGGPRRPHWTRLAELGWSSASVIHPGAHVAGSASIGEGSVVGPGAVVGAETVVGAHTLLSRGALVGHHVSIGGFAAVMPGANVGGHAEIGDGATLGMGSVVVNGARVGSEATVAAGAVVLGEVAAGSRVQGVPAREYRA